MNWYLIAAGTLALIVGAVHSVLGERLIFKRLRKGSVVPTEGGSALRESQLRILWATWHVATAMGCGLAAVLIWLARPTPEPWLQRPALLAVAMAMLLSAVLVLVGTRGRHPGWAGLLGVALLTSLGAYA